MHARKVLLTFYGSPAGRGIPVTLVKENGKTIVMMRAGKRHAAV